MNLTEVAHLLAYVASVDKWMEPADAATAEFRCRGWATILEDVTAEWAMQEVRRYYSGEHRDSIKPADLLTAWRKRVRVAEAKERVAETREIEATSVREAAETLASGAPAWFHTYRAQCDAARAAGLPYPPAPHEAKTTRPDPRERRCVNHDICACTHTECWDGWLDQESTVGIRHGHTYRGTKRCPICADAVLMREELTPKRRRGRR